MAKPKGDGNGFVMTIVWIVLVVIFAGLAGYFYFQNMNLASQVSTVNAQSQSVSGQVSSLQAQVASLTTSNTGASTQVASLQSNVQILKTELSFFAVPAGTNATTTNATISGMLSGGRPTFVLTTTDGVKVPIKNSADATVKAALQPLATSSQTVQLGGTYVIGSPIFTALTANGTSLYPPAAPTTTSSTAASSTGGLE
jgi:cell division protein FtsB